MSGTPYRDITLAIAASLMLSACAATVTCPEVDGDAARVAIILDHGHHASLVLENARGAPVRYSYGDRRWYADDDTGIGSALHAVFRQSAAVLARRELGAVADAESVRRTLGMVVQNSYTFQVPTANADILIAELDGIFFRDPDAIFRNFAPHPKPYTGWDNSNHVVAGWMELLGCEVSGSPMLSVWRVRGQAAKRGE